MLDLRRALPLLALLAAPAPADLRLPSVIGENMVLQRDTDAPLWGQADPGSIVTVRGSWGAEARAVADAAGRWHLMLATPPAGGPHALSFEEGDGASRIAFDNVLSGEVWVCSGQSNMEWRLNATDNGDREIANANWPRIRLFDVTNTISLTPEEDCKGSWAACTPSSVVPFSAVGYFFGRELHRELDVPIGLIGTNWGGTVAESWTGEETLRSSFPEFDGALDRIAEAREDPGRGASSLSAQQQAWWQGVAAKDPGMAGGWMEAAHGLEGWDAAEMPALWRDFAADALGGFDGIVWFRREVNVPAHWAGKDLVLSLGGIDDMDVSFWNGAEVGGFKQSGLWQTPREHKVPGEFVRAGKNVVAVCAVDTGGAGGFNGDADQLHVALDGDAGSAISLAGTWHWRRGAAMGELGAWPSRGWFHQNQPTALFNGMIAPLLPYAIRGAIWYQGESNRPRAFQYRSLFPAMITDWRARWGRGDFPFYFVQIAPFGYGGDQGQAAELREAQLLTMERVPNAGMAVTMDIGNPRDIHPRNKVDVGKRLAAWALAKDYGRDVVYSGPAYREMRVEGASARLAFDHVHGGLVARGGGALTHFTIAGEDRVFHPAEARIDGDEVVVTSAAVAQPVAVRFAWGAADEPNLANGAGLPASSFRTDDWKGVTQP